ncbi:MAG: serine/threonine protein kinase [Candidatus Sumerlaeaceae bacterium]|nr:serine/threonine protein kinase [Candidatus Sumerlaeaceae bacterium]
MDDKHTVFENALDANVQRIGTYSVIKSLGRGGMGEVVKALDELNQRYVAIKKIDPDAGQDPELIRRFEREATSVHALDHVNIAKIYGMEYDENNSPFIVMEFIDGEPLDVYCKRNPNAPFSTLVDFVVQVARGLEMAFRHSIIHRDIKPTNLLVTPDGVVKIIDFGLAKSLWDRSMLTGTNMVVGTPRYLSPEQGMGRAVDHRSDIYSLGATFYELVTRQCPFDGETAMAIMLKHVNTPLMPPYMINPKVPADINEIICKMMAKDPSQRYQDYDRLISELESAKIHRLGKERRIGDAGSPTLLSEDNGALSESGHGGGTPRSYLTEGLVSVELKDLPDPEPESRFKTIMLSLFGVLIIGAAIVAYVKAGGEEKEGEPSAITKWVAGLINKGGEIREKTPDEIVAEDNEKAQVTMNRIDGTVLKIINYRREPGKTGIPRMKELVSEGVVAEEDAKDAWGNAFVITSSSGGTIKSFGRDGQEDTDDDFVYSLNGTQLKAAKPLSSTDLAIRKQKSAQ